MNLDEAITGRRSVRKYDDTVISDELIREIITAGVWAPSACDLQQWKFIVINKKEIFEELYKLGSASFVKNAKQGILVLYNNQTDNVEYSDFIQSAAAAIENMLLKAYSLNIGTCWVNNLPNKNVLRKHFDIPASFSPVALVTLGYYSQKVNKRNRKYNLDNHISYNRFDFNEIEHRSWYSIKLKRFARRIYKCMPFKTKLLRFIGKLEKKFDN